MSVKPMATVTAVHFVQVCNCICAFVLSAVYDRYGAQMSGGKSQLHVAHA